MISKLNEKTKILRCRNVGDALTQLIFHASDAMYKMLAKLRDSIRIQIGRSDSI